MAGEPLSNDTPRFPAAPGFDFRGFGPALDPLANQAANQAFSHTYGRQGYLAAPFTPGVNPYHQLEAQGRLLELQKASQQAAMVDRAQAAQAFDALQRLVGQQTSAWSKAQVASMPLPVLAQMFPETIDRAFGPTGSASVMALGVGQGLAHRTNPLGGGYTGSQMGAFTTGMFSQLYRPGADMSGFRAGQAGQIFDEMSRRGLAGSVPAAAADLVRNLPGGQGGGADQFLQKADVSAASRKVQDMAKALSAVNDLLGANGQANAPIPKLFEVLDKLTHGQSHALSGGAMEAYVRRAHALSTQVAGGLERYAQVSRYAGGVAGALGLDPAFAVQMAEGSTAFGEAFGRRAGAQGFGGLSKDAATLLDTQLRGAAIGSDFARSLGGFMAMDEAGLIKGGPAADLVKAVRSRDSKALAGYANLDPGRLLDIATRSGVSAATAGSFFRGGAGVNEQVFRHGIGDLVRGVQGAGQTSQFVSNALAAGMLDVLDQFGGGGDMAQRAAQAVAMELGEIRRQDPELMTDPKRLKERNNRLKNAVRRVVGGTVPEHKLDELVAAAYQHLEASIASSPDFAKFGNVAGLFAMMAGDVHGEAHAIRRDAAGGAQAAKNMGPLTNNSGAIGAALGALRGGMGIGGAIGAALGAVDARGVELATEGGWLSKAARAAASAQGVKAAGPSAAPAGPLGAGGSPVPVVIVNPTVPVSPGPGSGGNPNNAGSVPTR
jgi:hypothetical protein